MFQPGTVGQNGRFEVGIEETGGGEMRMDADVIIVGGGPTGMMLAAELALAGVEAVVLERRSGAEIESPPWACRRAARTHD